MNKKYHYEEAKVHPEAKNWMIFHFGIAGLTFLGLFIGMIAGELHKAGDVVIISNVVILIVNVLSGAARLDQLEKTKRVRVYDPEPVEPGTPVEPISDDEGRKILLGDNNG